MTCEPNLADELVDSEGSEEELSDKLPPSPRFGVGTAEILVMVVDVVSSADSEGIFVAFSDGLSPGISSRKHFEVRGVEMLYNDQGLVLSSRYFPSAPSVASNPKPTSKIASLTTSTPVFEVPVSLPQAPPSPISTISGSVFVQ